MNQSLIDLYTQCPQSFIGGVMLTLMVGVIAVMTLETIKYFIKTYTIQRRIPK